MASLVRYKGKETADGKTPTYYQTAFRFGGKRFLRSLETTDEREARKHLASIKDTLKLISEGRIDAPANAEDFWAYVFSGGRRKNEFAFSEGKTFGSVIEEYLLRCPEGTKEQNTMATERIHFNRFKIFFRAKTPIGKIGVDEIEAYISDRQKHNGKRGQKISPLTIRKELSTLNILWKFANERGYVGDKNPIKIARKPKADADAPFETWELIEKATRSPKMTAHEKAIRWSCLYLTEDQITGLLAHVATVDPLAFAAIAFVSYTGCRRSEMMRCAVADVDFRASSIRIREKKKSRKLNTTYRNVKMHPKLVTILKAYLKNHHDGGPVLFPREGDKMNGWQADGLFKKVVANSKWSVIEGYHVLRHSFISLCAMRGISQAIIDAWVGHTSEAMRQRYRHLFPAELENAMERLFS